MTGFYMKCKTRLKMGQGRNKLETTFQMTKKLRSVICRKIRIKQKGVYQEFLGTEW